MATTAALISLLLYFGVLALGIYINYRIMKRAVRLGIKEAYKELKDELKKMKETN